MLRIEVRDEKLFSGQQIREAINYLEGYGDMTFEGPDEIRNILTQYKPLALRLEEHKPQAPIRGHVFAELPERNANGMRSGGKFLLAYVVKGK